MKKKQLLEIFVNNGKLSKKTFISSLKSIIENVDNFDFENLYSSYSNNFDGYKTWKKFDLLIPFNFMLKQNNYKYWLIRGYSEDRSKELAKEWNIFFNKRNSRYCKEFWIHKGYSEKDAIVKISEIQKNNNNKAYNSKIEKNYKWSPVDRMADSLILKGYSKNDAYKKAKSEISKKYKKSSCLTIEGLINNNYAKDEKEASILLKNRQTKASKAKRDKKYENLEDYKKTMNVYLEFYLNKGYNEEEAKKLLKDRQSTFSFKKCIKKYGEIEGPKIFENRQLLWKNSMELLPDDVKKNIKYHNGNATLEYHIEKYGEIEGIKIFKDRHSKRMKKLIKNTKQNYKYYGVSRESINFFESIISELSDFDFTYLYDENELMLYGNGKTNFYDFTIPEIKTIIEYCGTHVHANPNWSDSKKNKWMHVFNKEKYDICYKNDKLKFELAEKNGYDIYVIYTDDDVVEFKKNFVNKIKELNESGIKT